MRKLESNLEFPLSVVFIWFPLLRNWKKRSELGVRIFVHSERKFVARVCSCFLSLSYTISLAMNKVSLKGARAPSSAAVSHWMRSVQQTSPANSTVPTASVLLNFTLHVLRGFTRGELSYLAPLGSENISAPYFKQCFFRGGGLPPRLSQTPRLPVPRQK